MNLSLKEQNITRAAEALFISQPSLSIAIKKIEEEVGAPLFIRSKKQLKLTQQGRIFIEAGEQIKKSVRTMRNNILNINVLNSGELIIGMPPHLGALIFPQIRLRFKEKYPGITIQLVEMASQELEAKVLSGEIDMAVSALPISNPVFFIKPFFESRMFIVMAQDNPLNAFSYKKNPDDAYAYLDLKQTASYPFILGHKGQKTRAVIENMLSKAGIVPKIQLLTRNHSTMKRIVATSDALGILPEIYLYEHDESLHLHYYLIEPEYAEAFVATAFYLDALSPAAEKCLEMLVEFGKAFTAKTHV